MIWVIVNRYVFASPDSNIFSFHTRFCFFVSQSFSLRREFSHSSAHANNKEGRNVYFTLSFAGVALVAAIFVGIAVAKWRTARSPHAQGFIEVDQVSTSIAY